VKALLAEMKETNGAWESGSTSAVENKWCHHRVAHQNDLGYFAARPPADVNHLPQSAAHQRL